MKKEKKRVATRICPGTMIADIPIDECSGPYSKIRNV